MFRLRRAIYDIEKSEVQDKLLDEYRSQNEELKKVNSDLKDSFKAEKQGLQERIVLLGKHLFLHILVRFNGDNFRNPGRSEERALQL